ncbi:MAG: cell wall metabolism sensor histidine kinase WalK [Chloroflexota bacterium]|nr:cell wall metabolism sensor histidine kinase WalK [Chloroflexota bacterium]
MEPAAFLSIALLASLAAAGLLVALVRGRTIGSLREIVGVQPEGDVEAGVRAAIHARETADWEARRVAEDLAHLANLVGVGIVRLDDGLVVRMANEAAHAYLERPPAGLSGLTAIEAFGDHRIEEIARRARELGWANGEIVRGGSQQTLVIRARRSPVSGFWLVMEDVSELRRLQRIRTEFIDNLSHELRTPLTNVRLLTETLARDLDRADLPPRIRDGILKIDVESGHLVQMVNELLDLSKIEQGSIPLHLDTVDLGEVVRASVDRLRLFADRQGVRLATDVAPDLSPVRGDDERLGQMLVNLLHNAVKFSSAGDVVTVGARNVGDEVVLSVEDRGVGIPVADVGRVFERFYKVDKARVRGKGGTGLGLAIVRHIAEGHGGRAWVESEEGAGSTFSVAIPTGEAG